MKKIKKHKKKKEEEIYTPTPYPVFDRVTGHLIVCDKKFTKIYQSPTITIDNCGD